MHFREDEKSRRWDTVKVRQHRIVTADPSQPGAPQADMHSSMLDSGFSMSDIKGGHHSFSTYF